MERIVLFLVLGAFLTGSYFTMSVERNTLDADQALNDYHHKKLSREVAVAGLRTTVRKLAEASDSPWTTASSFSATSTPHSGGTYEVDVRVIGTGDTVDVYVLGTYGPDTTRIDARYERAFDTEGVPPAFRSVILTDDLLQISGNITVTTLDANLNANVHTNGTLSTNGNAFVVEGYGSYSDPNGNQTTQADNFQPSPDYNGSESNVVQIPPVQIPDATLEKTHADVTYAWNQPDYIQTTNNNNAPIAINVIQMGDTYCSNPASAPTGFVVAHCGDANGDGLNDLGRTKAFVLWAERSVQLKNVHITGNAVFYAHNQNTTGVPGVMGIEIDRVVRGELNSDNETMTMLRTPGNINVHGNDEIRASIWANGEVTFHGTPTMTGNILSPTANFEGNGNFALTYAAPSSIITDPGYQNITPVGPVLIGYAEWDEETL